MEGKFSRNVPEDAVLVFSLLGFESLDVPVDVRAVINVVLRVSENMLDELVVVGYGTQKKENLTGAVSQIGSEVLENRSVTSVSQALQGVMAGVSVQQTEGRPGANARSEEHTSELQSLMRTSYAVCCLHKKQIPPN